MRYTRKVLLLLVLIFITISFTKCERSKDVRVVFVAPVLAPYRSARAQSETAKDFPLLMLLASDDKPIGTNKTNDSPVLHRPTYVKKRKGQKNIVRRRRRTSRIYFVNRY